MTKGNPFRINRYKTPMPFKVHGGKKFILFRNIKKKRNF
jgi:hypothetical protein